MTPMRHAGLERLMADIMADQFPCPPPSKGRRIIEWAGAIVITILLVLGVLAIIILSPMILLLMRKPKCPPLHA
jgi:hypothetical protein